MFTLGINAVFHDSAAALVADGEVVAAAEEERFTRIKHAKRPVPFSAWELPYHAIDFCLSHAGIGLEDLDHVSYSCDPHLLDPARPAALTLPLEPSAAGGPAPWDPLLVAYVVNAERQLLDGAPHHLAARFSDARRKKRWKWHFIEHHLCHEASAFLAAPFQEAAVMTLDGRGEHTATSYGHYEQDRYRRLGQVPLPNSLGLLYEDVTEYLGFLRSSDEYKVMALASFGKPVHRDVFREILEVNGDGTYTVGPLRLEERFGPARRRGEPLEQKHFDVACSLQRILEESVLHLAEWLERTTGAENLCLAGGVALNCVVNARLEASGIFRRIWVQPAAGDAGTALGAALWTDWQARGRNRRYRMEHVYLGPEFEEDAIERFLRRSKLPYRRMQDVPRETAGLLAEDKVIGWFEGRMEFGPRALGARSILASPRSQSMQQRLNWIKDREDFRPFAPVVIEEEASRWFDGCDSAPFMVFVFDVAADKVAHIPAVQHVDGTARVQTIRRELHPLYYDLLKAFEERTGVPVLLNTSLNTLGQPIVCTPVDAVNCFSTSPLDALVIGPFLLDKERR